MTAVSKLHTRISALRESEFARSVGILMSGTVFAQALAVVTMPVLTRLYTPADFNLLAVLAGVIAIVGVVSCLRYDVAIAVPDDDAEAAALLLLSIGLSIAAGLLSAVPLLLAPAAVTQLLGQPTLRPWLWMLPTGITLYGSCIALQMWFVRAKRFTDVASSRIAQAVGVAAGQIGCGLAALSPFGLLLGPVANPAIGAAILGRRFISASQATLSGLTFRSIMKAARAHHQYPRFSALEALCNVASQQLPIVIIAATATGAEGGYVSLAMYAMQAPMALIGTAISQVYMSRAPAEFRAGTLGAFTGGVIVQLIRIGVGPLIFLGIVSPFLFGYIFGPSWGRAGELVAWMTPWFVMQLVVVPVSLALAASGNQKRALGLQIFGFAVRVLSVGAAAFYADRFIAEIFAVSGFVFYATYLWIIIRATHAKLNGQDVLPSVAILSGWTTLGITTNVIIWSIS